MMKSLIPTIFAAVFLAGCATSRSFVTDAQVIGPYSPAVKVGNTLYVSGQIAMKPGTTELAADDIEIQTRQVLDNLKGILAKAGYEMTDVVQCTVYLKDINDFAKMNQIYGVTSCRGGIRRGERKRSRTSRGRRESRSVR